MLTAGLISAVIGEQLPGHGTIYLGQSLKFLGPATVTDMDIAKRRVKMDCRCTVDGKPVLATVLAPSAKLD